MCFALKVIMKPNKEGNIDFEAWISIVKQQFFPIFLTVCVSYPIAIAQICGRIRLSKLDEKTIEIAERAMYQYRNNLAILFLTGSGSYPNDLFHLEFLDDIYKLAEPFCDIKGFKTAPKIIDTVYLHYYICKSSVN